MTLSHGVPTDSFFVLLLLLLTCSLLVLLQYIALSRLKTRTRLGPCGSVELGWTENSHCWTLNRP